MIIIAGAGLTGLSTAYYLKDKPYSIFELEMEPGGLCRSIKSDGFTFDYTGHLFHSKDPCTKQFLDSILPAGFKSINRKAAVYCMGRYVPYPFQANTFGLPQEVVFECVMGFINSCMSKKAVKSNLNFRDWALSTFGEGISNHFRQHYGQWRV